MNTETKNLPGQASLDRLVEIGKAAEAEASKRIGIGQGFWCYHMLDFQAISDGQRAKAISKTLNGAHVNGNREEMAAVLLGDLTDELLRSPLDHSSSEVHNTFRAIERQSAHTRRRLLDNICS